jgi:AcrR family transcriptional regulator
VGRRGHAPSKGDRREQALLDAAETLLEQTGLEQMTVDAIAKGAGISRGSLYFYFGSKQEVLASLVDRTMATIQADAASTAGDLDSSPEDAMEKAVRRVERTWREHGTVMRAAVDHAIAHPAIGAAWNRTVEIFADTMKDVLVRAGAPDGPGTTDASALARALCWMTERTFYQAARGPDEALTRAAETSIEIWRRTIAPDPARHAPN